MRFYYTEKSSPNWLQNASHSMYIHSTLSFLFKPRNQTEPIILQFNPQHFFLCFTLIPLLGDGHCPCGAGARPRGPRSLHQAHRMMDTMRALLPLSSLCSRSAGVRSHCGAANSRSSRVEPDFYVCVCVCVEIFLSIMSEAKEIYPKARDLIKFMSKSEINQNPDQKSCLNPDPKNQR